MRIDWRHYTGAGVLLLILLGIFWWLNFRREAALPTAPAPAGANPVDSMPPER